MAATHRVALRTPRGEPISPDVDADASSFLSDASFLPGGHAVGVFRPRSERGVVEVLLKATAVLPIGAQSSVTGGATPFGETVLSLQHFRRLALEGDELCVGAGISLRELQAFLEERDRWLPGTPTYDGAQVGGALSTNAAGATTFKYGSIRDRTVGLTIALGTGEILELRRGQYRAHPEGYFDFLYASGSLRVTIPTYVMPNVDKRSAGYFAAPQMDLIDLFVGAEGTLGVILEARLQTSAPRPRVGVALVPCPDETTALGLTAALRSLAVERRAGNPKCGLDVSAIEYMDARCVELIKEDQSDQRLGFHLQTGTLLLVQMELLVAQETQDFERFVALLEQHQVSNDCLYAPPDDSRAASAMFALREAVPEGINARFARAKREVDAGITKVGADMIVPFDRLREAMHAYRAAFTDSGVDYAIWGHASDGNMHPNMLPRRIDDIASAKRAVMEMGRKIIALGGCPLAEHGVGRSAVKQALLEQLYGSSGVKQMRALKQALDPRGVLSPGVLMTRL